MNPWAFLWVEHAETAGDASARGAGEGGKSKTKFVPASEAALETQFVVCATTSDAFRPKALGASARPEEDPVKLGETLRIMPGGHWCGGLLGREVQGHGAISPGGQRRHLPGAEKLKIHLGGSCRGTANGHANEMDARTPGLRSAYSLWKVFR